MVSICAPFHLEIDSGEHFRKMICSPRRDCSPESSSTELDHLIAIKNRRECQNLIVHLSGSRILCIIS